MTKFKAAFGRAGRFLSAHKKAVIALLLVAAAAAGILVWRQRGAARLPAGADLGGQSYVRTITLQKGTLDDSISASGTVESDDVSNVTTELKYTVKTVNVQVGDSVNAGDVICTLDTADLEKSITKMKESLAEAKEKALKNYQNAQESLTEAQESVTEAYDSKEDKRSARDSAKSAYESAAAQVAAYQSAYDAANADLLARLNERQSAQAAYDQALANAQAAAGSAASSAAQGEAGADGQGETVALAPAAAPEDDAAVKAAKEALEAARKAYESAEATLQTAQGNLNTAKSSTHYDTLQTAYTQAQSAYEQAKSSYEQAQKAAETAESSRDDALETYNKAGESDELEELQQELEKCTLKAETSGKVTAVNATVGSAVNGAAATIQNTDKLKIALSIAEYDIEKVKTGMKAVITSDVITGEVSGTLTQISPTASGGGSSSSGFAAEVTVDQADSGLLVGTNAKVKIILSTTENVFAVPLDAIEEQEDGTSVIYVKNGEDADGQPTFEPMAVTVGTANDYYAEISGSGLSEGMVVRAAANESEAADTADQFQMGGMMGGADVQVSMGAAPAMPDGGQPGGPGGAPGMGG
ncbi:efflux RND transporter periplasmic adaptor subunit [Allofournierella sp.]|uniref:efflux RND transporter periplasmic adaptor subunit n=1 Tax=Allofournierella sp. TaxID=1940256 RepID=UPI003AB14ED9